MSTITYNWPMTPGHGQSIYNNHQFPKLENNMATVPGFNLMGLNTVGNPIQVTTGGNLSFYNSMNGTNYAHGSPNTGGSYTTGAGIYSQMVQSSIIDVQKQNRLMVKALQFVDRGILTADECLTLQKMIISEDQENVILAEEVIKKAENENINISKLDKYVKV